MKSLLEKFYSSGVPNPKIKRTSHQQNSMNLESSINNNFIRHKASRSNNLLNSNSNLVNHSKNYVFTSKPDKENLNFTKDHNNYYDKSRLLNFINNQILDIYSNNPYINTNGINNHNPVFKKINENQKSNNDTKYKILGSDYYETDYETKKNKRQYLKGLFYTPREKRSILLKGTKDPEKMASLMNKNLEEFQSDFHKEIRNLKKVQEQTSLHGLIEELHDLRNSEANELVLSERKRRNDFENFLENMKILKNQISEKLTINNKKQMKNLDLIKEEFDCLKTDLTKKIENVEKKQKIQLETINYLQNYDQDNFKEELEGEIFKTEKYKKPLKKELKLNLNEIKDKKMNLKNFQLDDIEEDKEYELDEYLSHKRMLNEDLNQMDKSHELILDKKHKSKSLFERMKICKLEKFEEMKKSVSKYTLKLKKPKKLKKISKFRSSVNAIILINKLKISVRETKNQLKIESFNFFKANFKDFEKMLNHMIYFFIKEVYSNILLTDSELSIAILDKNFNQNNKIQLDARFIRLETRLTSIFEKLIENTNNKTINANIVNFFQVLLTDNTSIPLYYFTCFERERMKFTGDLRVQNMNMNQKKMIICFQILLKILVKNVLIDYKIPNAKRPINETVQRNIKMIATVIYRTVVDHFVTKIPPFKQGINKAIIQTLEEGQTEDFMYPSFDIGMFEYSDPSYFEHQKELQKSFFETKKNEEREYIELNSFFKRNDDNNANEVYYIQKDLYKKNEIKMYYKYAELNNYDLTPYVMKWVDKFYSLIFTN